MENKGIEKISHTSQPSFSLWGNLRFAGCRLFGVGRFATRVELLLYERSDSPESFQVIEPDPEINRTFSDEGIIISCFVAQRGGF